METNNNKQNGAYRVLAIIVAVVLLVFICWKAGWILNGNKNDVPEQEKQEAIQEAAEEVNDNLQELQDEFRDAFK